MKNQRHTKSDDKPQDEFRNDRFSNKDKTSDVSKKREKNYEEWTLEQLLCQGTTVDKEQRESS